MLRTLTWGLTRGAAVGLLTAVVLWIWPSASPYAKQDGEATKPAPTAVTATAPKRISPSDTDQLALVRLRAKMSDCEARMRAAQQQFEQARQAFDAAKKEQDDAGPQVAAKLKEIISKAPKPSAGKQWQVVDDGKMGYDLIEVDEAPQPAKPADVKPNEKDGKKKEGGK